MKIVFVTNTFTRHQRFFADEICKNKEIEFTYITTYEVDSAKREQGFYFKEEPQYVKFFYADYESAKECQQLIDNADLVIAGSAPEKILKDRIRSGKILIRYSERPLKKGIEPLKFIPRLIKWNLKNPANKPIYMLCASAYAAADYRKFGLFKNKTYKWGYFPEVKNYEDVKQLIEEKEINSILWTARIIDWKHPEIPIEVAKRLKQDGYSFKMNIIGTGVMEEEIKKRITDENLNDCVRILGYVLSEQVREYMEKSEVFLFTSDFNEGWGAVLNEAMNSGCAVVASHAIGAAPYLLKTGENGLIYKNGDVDDLYKKVKWLLDNPKERKIMGEKAYYTMLNEWSPEAAANRFVVLVKELMENGQCDEFDRGPCSRAGRIKNNWYKANENLFEAT